MAERKKIVILFFNVETVMRLHGRFYIQGVQME